MPLRRMRSSSQGSCSGLFPHCCWVVFPPVCGLFRCVAHPENIEVVQRVVQVCPDWRCGAACIFHCISVVIYNGEVAPCCVATWKFSGSARINRNLQAPEAIFGGCWIRFILRCIIDRTSKIYME